MTTREHGLLFTGDMIRAILDGTKTQTRRPVTQRNSEVGSLPQRDWTRLDFSRAWVDNGSATRNPFCAVDGMQYLHVPHTDGPGESMEGTVHRVYPRIEPGHVMWARETWRTYERPSDLVDGILFRADDAFVPIENTVEAADRWIDAHAGGKHGEKWRPSILMPRWAARIVRPIASVRVERVQDISEEDARAEGADRQFLVDAATFVRGSLADLDRASTYRNGFRSLWRDTYGAESWEANPWVWVIEFAREGEG